MNVYSEVTQALQKIKDICQNSPDCYSCPLGNDDGICMLERDIPNDWDIKDNPTPTVRLLG